VKPGKERTRSEAAGAGNFVARSMYGAGLTEQRLLLCLLWISSEVLRFSDLMLRIDASHCTLEVYVCS
jgi:hypothetical protein